MSRLDSDIYDVYTLVNDSKLILSELETSDERSEVEDKLDEIQSLLLSIEADADEMEDKDVDTDDIERSLSNMEDALSDYISEIRRELP